MNVQKLLIIVTLVIHASIGALPQPLFWLPPWFIQPPRFERDFLTTGKIQVRGGANDESFSHGHHKTALLNLYGSENIRLLAENVPASELGPDTFLNTLWEGTPSAPSFGTINWRGQISTFELMVDVIQNFKYGIFAEIVVPLRWFDIKSLDFTDNSTPQTAGDINYTQWRSLINNLPTVLMGYGIDIDGARASQLGDIQVLLGWTENNQSFEYIDFWDYSLTTGIFAKSSTKPNPAEPFLLSSGFDHHTAIALSANTAVGIYDWMTAGAFVTGYFFVKNRYIAGVKSAAGQNGWIKLAREEVEAHKGNIYHLGGYISADHVVHAFSATLGFSYAHEAPSRYAVLSNAAAYDPVVVNSDIQLQSWSMLTMHWQFELDFANHENPGHPQIAIIIDVPIAGKRAMRNRMLGLYLQSNIMW